MNGYGGDWRFQQHGREDDRSMGMRGRDMERGGRGGWARDDDQRERSFGSGMRDRDEWRSGNGRGGSEGWGYEGRGERMRGDDDVRLERGEAPIVKVIEVVAQSPHSWEDATRRAVAEASRTIDDIKSIYVKDMQAIVANGRIVEFRLVAKISFAVHEHMRSRRAREGRREYA
ncbi:Dodecin [Sandaracinus amylolyticus]|uniref:Dodecin n=2 Tax=Sandaracinus amylolyticus TaxID=927083 RepID=A0A0F6W007_9BACT|nr:Dodecin [Sandaracinus amylolyticus]